MSLDAGQKAMDSHVQSSFDNSYPHLTALSPGKKQRVFKEKTTLQNGSRIYKVNSHFKAPVIKGKMHGSCS